MSNAATVHIVAGLVATMAVLFAAIRIFMLGSDARLYRDRADWLREMLADAELRASGARAELASARSLIGTLQVANAEAMRDRDEARAAFNDLFRDHQDMADDLHRMGDAMRDIVWRADDAMTVLDGPCCCEGGGCPDGDDFRRPMNPENN